MDKAAGPRPRMAAFRLGDCLIDPRCNRITSNGQSVRVEPRVMEVLLALCRRPGEVVSKSELMDSVWHDVFVTEGVLTHAVWQLRKALGDAEIVESIPKRGYRVTKAIGAGPRSGVDGADLSRTRGQQSAIVVLPLANLSADSDQEYFADGMTEALISRLAQFRTLRVISRSSAMYYKGQPKPLFEIASELNIDAAIEGSVFRHGQRVRISVQLIDARNDTHLWAGSYERDLADVIELQRELAETVARHVGNVLAVPASLASRSVNPAAYEAYLQGRVCWFRFSSENFDAALSFFQTAHTLDPTFAQPLSGIAQVWFARENSGFVPPSIAVPLARSAAEDALSLDDSAAEAHSALGLVEFHYDWDWAGAEQEFQRSIELGPGDPGTRIYYSDLLHSLGRPQDGLEHIKLGLELDPLNPACRCFLGWYLLFSRRPQDALHEFRKVIGQDPAYGAAHQGMWGAYFQMRHWSDAIQEARTFFSIRGESDLIPVECAGDSDNEYRRIMRGAANRLQQQAKATYIPNLRIARLYAHASEIDDAFHWLERAYSERESPLVHLGVGWDWDNISSDSRFAKLLAKIGLPAASPDVNA